MLYPIYNQMLPIHSNLYSQTTTSTEILIQLREKHNRHDRNRIQISNIKYLSSYSPASIFSDNLCPSVIQQVEHIEAQLVLIDTSSQHYQYSGSYYLPGSNINRSLDSRCSPPTLVCTTPPKMKIFPPQLHAQCPSRGGKLPPTFTLFHDNWIADISQTPLLQWLLHSPFMISSFIKRCSYQYNKKTLHKAKTIEYLTNTTNVRFHSIN